MLIYFSIFSILWRVGTSIILPNVITLNDGNKMPAIAFGTFVDIGDEARIEQSAITAIEAGYRHIDTAHLYLTEGPVGRAIRNVIRRGIVKREDLFITTKLDLAANCREKVVPALKLALRILQLDYVDSFLIHVPFNLLMAKKYDYVDIWRGMEDAKLLGLTKSIGLSNFNSSHINELLYYCTTRPAVNQIEVNPTYTNLDLVAYCQSEGIQVTAWSPFGFTVPRPRTDIDVIPPPSFNDPILTKIAMKYGKATSQVVLRYLVDRRLVPQPRSQNPDHIRSNVDIFDFKLTQKEIYTINEFNRNLRVYGLTDETLLELILIEYNRKREDFRRLERIYRIK